MSPTPEASERQRKAAYKAWETIRRKRSERKGETDEEIKKTRPTSLGVGRMKKRHVTGYPANWKEIGVEIRGRSKNINDQEQCECRGECLKHNGRCGEINGTWPQHRRKKGKVKVRFTIAHLCHNPACDDRSHLKAMCEPCHLIFDLRCRQKGLRGEHSLKWATQFAQS